MTNKRIIFSRPDGGVSIVTPLAPMGDMSEAEYLQWIIDKDVPADAVGVRIVDVLEIPADRTFRDALQIDLTHDKAKAVELTKERLRAERAEKLASLDVEYMRALEQGKPTAAIVAEKNRLRDVTKIPHAGMTLDELKTIQA